VSAQHLRLAHEILDHQLVDSDGVLCGKVDDIEFVEEGGHLRVESLLTGPGAARRRLPRWARATVGRLHPAHVCKVPWNEVSVVGAVIRLGQPSEALGLGTADRRWGRRLERLPRS
jgi:sporulation protein YlmC with PRC-barrel domain